MGLIWYTNAPNESTSPQKRVTTITNQKNTTMTPVIFEQKEIRKIDVASIKTKITKTFTKADDLKIFAVSMARATKGDLLLDEESADIIDCYMWITFQDGSYKKYFIWFDVDKNVTIAYQSNLEEVQLKGYQLTEDNSKQVNNLLKGIL